ncbi:MAG TPA: hypothetical protein VF933_17845 [Streptosporangiaceae bacterium]
MTLEGEAMGAVLNRLGRAQGQLAGVIAMIESGALPGKRLLGTAMPSARCSWRPTACGYAALARPLACGVLG